MEGEEEELIPNFFRIAYAYKYIVEDNMRKIDYVKQKSLESYNQKLTNQQVIILLRLTLLDSIQTSDLAESLNIALPNLINQLAKLEDHGLISKEQDNEDRRISNISLTKKGNRLLQDKPKTLDERYVDYLVQHGVKARYSSIFNQLLDDIRNHFPEVYDAVYTYH